jgi:hypothetical protein
MSENTNVTFSPLTPYAAAKVTNIVLATKGVEKTVTPQMFYSYAKNERIQTVTVEGDKRTYFDGQAFKTWLDQYVEGGAPGSKISFQVLAEQYL